MIEGELEKLALYHLQSGYVPLGVFNPSVYALQGSSK